MTERVDGVSALHALFDEAWEFELREDPLTATLFYGDHRYDDRLPGASEADFARRLATLRDFRTRLDAIAPQGLSPAERLNHALFARLLGDQIAELGFGSHLMPISKLGGFHAFFSELPLHLSLETVADYEHYLARLRAFPVWVDEHIELMRAGLRTGLVTPRVALEGVLETITPQLNDEPQAGLLYGPFREFPAAVPGGERERLAAAGRAAIRDAVTPAYRALAAFLEREYLPGARETIAASALPNGAAYYAHRVRMHTTLEVTPEEVHATGLREVARIRAEMDARMRATGFSGDFPAFLSFLREDARFYAETPDGLMKEVALILKRMDGELPRLFKTLPRTPYGIRPVPEHIAPRTTTAYYMPPAADGSRAGHYYVNTYDLRSRPLYELEALSLHEAVPGHHLHLALQLELPAMPNFRRFAGLTAFVEGWALYAERLGLEVGFYQDPYSDFGRLTYEMWRACRLVVDSGLHALGWTRQQAIDYMAENTALALLNIANEVDRYIAWPGQALAYKMGELAISGLRARAEQALGPAFDRREFHERVLANGAVPLDMLSGLIDEWLAGAASPASAPTSAAPA